MPQTSKIIDALLKKALYEGITFQQFKKALLNRLNISSIDKDANRILEQTYHTFLMIEYSKMRFNEMMDNIDDRPYWMYVSINDSRTCDECKKLAGKVFRYDDIFWKDNYPPNHIGCRCRVRALRYKDIKEKNLQVESSQNITTSFKKEILLEDLDNIKEAVIGYLNPR